MNLPIHVIILDYENNGGKSCSPVLINNAESKFKNNKPVKWNFKSLFHNTELIITEGHIASIAALVILVLVIIGYVILYISTKSIGKILFM